MLSVEWKAEIAVVVRKSARDVASKFVAELAVTIALLDRAIHCVNVKNCVLKYADFVCLPLINFTFTYFIV